MLFILAILAAIFVWARWHARTMAMERSIANLTARMRLLEEQLAHMGSAPAGQEKAPVPAPSPAPPPSNVPPVPVRAHGQIPSVSAATAPPPTPASAPLPPAAAKAVEADPASRPESLESRIGSRWLLYVGILAIVVGVSYFEKLAIESQWIGPVARVLQGCALGLVLAFVGLRFVRAGYSVYGRMISGGGVAVLYVSTYAAFDSYQLVSRPIALAAMTAITMLAAWLADRQRSQALALVAVGGGFVTPFLLPGGGSQVALFGYESILIAGTMVLAHRREWPHLNLASYVLTVLTALSWAVQFYSDAQYLVTELFITAFCAMFLYIRREGRRSPGVVGALASAVLLTAPAIYYLASLAILSTHSIALLVYLIALTIVGTAIGRGRASALRVVFWAAAILPLCVWSAQHSTTQWLLPGLTTVAAVYTLHLLAHLDATFASGHRLNAGDVAMLHLNGLGAFGAAYLLLGGVHLAATAPLAAVFAIWHGALAWTCERRVRQRDHALHFAALAFTLLVFAIGLQFDGPAATMGWTAEASAILALGLVERRTWLRVGGLLLMLVAVRRLLALLFSPPAVDHVAILNARAGITLFAVALICGLAWLHHRKSEPTARGREVGAALVTTVLLLLAAAASEIRSYWLVHLPPPFQPASQLAAAWVLAGAGIVWLGLYRRQEWIRVIGGLTLAAGAFLLLSTQLESAPASYRAILNGRAAAGLLTIGVLYALALAHRRLGEHVVNAQAQIAVLLTAASLFSLSWLTSEIDAFWSVRGAAHQWSMARAGTLTIAWAAVGSTIVWIGVTRTRRWIQGVGAFVLVVAVARLLQLELAAAPPGYIVLANTRLIASLFVIGLLYGLASLYRRANQSGAVGPDAILVVLANVLTIVFLTSEITAFWQLGDSPGMRNSSVDASSHFAREMMLSVTWAAYATALVVAGLRKRYAPIRYFAMALFAVTIVKVFAVDLANLDRIYRVLSIVGLGVMLLMSSYLYNRFRANPAR